MTSHIQVAQHLLKNHNEHVLKQGHGYRVLSPRAGVRMLVLLENNGFSALLPLAYVFLCTALGCIALRVRIFGCRFLVRLQFHYQVVNCKVLYACENVSFMVCLLTMENQVYS